MADALHASAVLKVARDRLVAALGDAATTHIPANSRGDLEDMKDMTDAIALALEGAEGWAVTSDPVGWALTVGLWLQRFGATGYDIWDMVDEIQANKGAAPMAMMLRRPVNPARASKILREKLMEMKAEAEKLGFRDYLSRPHARETHPYLREEILSVARYEEKQRIVDLLSSLCASDGKEWPIFLPIFGLAGVGKTTLAKMVFHHTAFQGYARVWVHVSPSFDLTRIARSIIERLPFQRYYDENLHSMELTTCRRRLDELLGGGNKVLIVLDDIWEQEDSKLDELKRMLGVDDQTRKLIVIVTTRDEGIARKICTKNVKPFKLHPLSDDLCWKIIKRTSRFEERNDKQELGKIGREIATKCGGIPLVAEVLGRILVGKSIDESLVLRSADVSWAVYQSDNRGTMIWSLDLSYQSMPPDMRLCFACLATLPDSQNIAKDDLIHRWIALGLIEPCGGISTGHQRGEYIISKLLDYSFLQLVNLTSTSKKGNKGVISFTMNCLVHSFARYAIRFTLVVVDGEKNTSVGRKYDWRYAVFTNFDIASSKLSSILPAEVRSLSLLGCIRKELSDDSFSFAKYLRVLELREPSMQKLPNSVCLLRVLRYLNLSGCSGLEQLPESFGNLTSVLHINLSGCFGLKNLPKSFGNLTNVVHINLSGCHGLDDLPKSFCKLNNLEYLDLSFCSCLTEFPTSLGGLTNLQHLNLSHPCCYDVEHKDHLGQLKDVWAKLTKLQYLNLSMFMNPIFCYQAEGESLDCFQPIKGLTSLEHLDLSHNIFLIDLPESLGDLNKLHTLDLSGCIRLKRIAKKIAEMQCLKTIVLRKCLTLESYSFAVRTDDGEYSSNVAQLEDVCCQELEINCLENVALVEEAKRIRLDNKRRLEKLTLGWAGGCHGSSVNDEALLAELMPPQNLQCFELKGYRGKCLPIWFTSSIRSHLPNLVGVTMEGIPNCSTLPPLFLLPKLQQVVLRKMAGIIKVDASELSGGNRAALRELLQFTLDDLENLQELVTIYHSGGEELMFPIIDELVIQNCPNVRFGPFPPTARRLKISSCDRLMSSLPKKEVGGPGTDVEASSSSTSTASARVTELVIKNCKVPLGDSSLLHHLPGIHRLEIWNSSDLTSSPETISQVQSSLRSLGFYQCNGMTSLPEYLGDLTSLQELTIDGCQNIKSLPQNIGKLKELRIQGCPELKMWCELEENKKKLAHIQLIYLESATAEPDSTSIIEQTNN